MHAVENRTQPPELISASLGTGTSGIIAGFPGVAVSMGNLIIDAFEFCRLQEQWDGTLAISALPRLQKEAPGDPRSVSWSVRGGANHVGHAQLELVVNGLISLSCQRCLSPVDVNIASTSRLVLAHSEDEADTIEALLADDTVDVVAVTKKMDIAELIEDEVLLAIPQSVKHEACPGQANAALDAVKKPSAFAALKDLKL